MRRVFLGVDEGVEKRSLPLRKRGLVVMSECGAFSDFAKAENGGDVDKRTCPWKTA